MRTFRLLMLVLVLIAILPAAAGARRTKGQCAVDCQFSRNPVPAGSHVKSCAPCDQNSRRAQRCARIAMRQLIRLCRHHDDACAAPFFCPTCPASGSGAFVDPCTGLPPSQGPIDHCAADCSATAVSRCAAKPLGKESRCISGLLRRLLPAYRQGRPVCHA